MPKIWKCQECKAWFTGRLQLEQHVKLHRWQEKQEGKADPEYLAWECED